MNVPQQNPLLRKKSQRLPPQFHSIDRISTRRQNHRWCIRDGQRERIISIFRGLIIEKQIQCDRAGFAGRHTLDQARELIARPRPHPNAVQAVFIDRNDHYGAGRWHRSGKPKSKIVGGGIQFNKIDGPRQQQDRNGHETASGYRSQHRLHYF